MCIFIYMHVCVGVRMHEWAYQCISVCIHDRVYLCMYVCINSGGSNGICILVSGNIRICVYTWIKTVVNVWHLLLSLL